MKDENLLHGKVYKNLTFNKNDFHLIFETKIHCYLLGLTSINLMNMTKRILIDARQNHETRVATINSNIVEDFEYEVHGKQPLRGNIYLARVTRVEPSLQAAFVEYGGNRQGFLSLVKFTQTIIVYL